MDKFYTPNDMARRILRTLALERPATVADFASGNGALLTAVRERWPSCRLFATDIDPGAVRGLRRKFSGISAAVCDFLSADAREGSLALRRALGRIALAFINPPFSCRGNSRLTVSFEGQQLSCSRALAFVVNTIPYLTPGGRILALLPASCLTSEKDAPAIAALTRKYLIERIGGAEPYEFKNCAVHVSFLSLRRRCRSSHVVSLQDLRPREVARVSRPTRIRAVVSRGNIQVHKVQLQKTSQGVSFVHTTDLRDGAVTSKSRVVTTTSIVHGPSILLPRVGASNLSKVCLLDKASPVAISDCVIAIRPELPSAANSLFEHIRSNWPLIAQQYGGSCAQYLTLKRLASTLQSIGISAVIDAKTVCDTSVKVTTNGKVISAA